MKMNEKGKLFVISAPSGCGKGTVLAEILKDDSFYYSVSATTRLPRDGETDGVNYHFLKKEEFQTAINEGKMLEYAEYCGNYYGTPAKYIDENLNKGKDVILEIEVNGALNVKKKRPEAVLVFMLPPSMKELKRRLEKRGTESSETINKRINEGYKEIEYAKYYDYIMVNGPIEDAVNDLKAIVRACKLKSNDNLELIDNLKNEKN